MKTQKKREYHRSSPYNKHPFIVEQVHKRLLAGQSVAKIAREVDGVSASTIYRWCNEFDWKAVPRTGGILRGGSP